MAVQVWGTALLEPELVAVVAVAASRFQRRLIGEAAASHAALAWPALSTNIGQMVLPRRGLKIVGVQRPPSVADRALAVSTLIYRRPMDPD